MLNTDFVDRTYTAEVIKCKIDADIQFKKILAQVIDPEIEHQNDGASGATIKICHAFLKSKRDYHRFVKSIVQDDGTEIAIPRQRTIRGASYNLYDVFVAQHSNHIVIAVPFHELAEEFFLQVDAVLGGTNAFYQKLDITKMVVKLGSTGNVHILTDQSGNRVGISVTRCHLAYAEQKNRTSNLQQVCMTGSNLGESDEYKFLISPVLKPHDSALTVTPIVLGFALSTNGVRKSSAITDRHGNFKIWIAHGMRRLIRIFELLDALEAMKNVTLTTNNVPILQSKTIRGAED